ncbi:MAG: hypothetical protein ACE5JA_04885, partial [bacterium]
MIAAQRGTILVILLVVAYAACAGGQTENVEPAGQGSTASAAGAPAGDSAVAIPTVTATTLQGPRDKDVMTAGGVVRVLTPVDGDLFVAAGEVSVDTSVMGDIWASGAVVSIGGSAGGDVRAAAYRVTLKGLVKSNATIFCNSFMQEPGSEVWGDLR